MRFTSVSPDMGGWANADSNQTQTPDIERFRRKRQMIFLVEWLNVSICFVL